MSNTKHLHRFSVSARDLRRTKPLVPESSNYQRDITKDEIIERVKRFNPNMKKYVTT